MYIQNNLYKNKVQSINYHHLFKAFSITGGVMVSGTLRVKNIIDFGGFLLEFAVEKTDKSRMWFQIPNVTLFCISRISKSKVCWPLRKQKAERSQHIVFQTSIFITFSYWLNQSCHHLLNYNSMWSTVVFHMIFHVEVAIICFGYCGSLTSGSQTNYQSLMTHRNFNQPVPLFRSFGIRLFT